MVQGSWKQYLESIRGSRFGRLDFPCGGIRRVAIRRPNLEALLKIGLQGISRCIPPGSVHSEHITFPGFERWSDFFQRLHAALDAAGIDKQREPYHRGVP